MKKSERYQAAMIAVLNTSYIMATDKLEIIETLMDAKSVAEYAERLDNEKE